MWVVVHVREHAQCLWLCVSGECMLCMCLFAWVCACVNGCSETEIIHKEITTLQKNIWGSVWSVYLLQLQLYLQGYTLNDNPPLHVEVPTPTDSACNALCEQNKWRVTRLRMLWREWTTSGLREREREREHDKHVITSLCQLSLHPRHVKIDLLVQRPGFLPLFTHPVSQHCLACFRCESWWPPVKVNRDISGAVRGCDKFFK